MAETSRPAWPETKGDPKRGPGYMTTAVARSTLNSAAGQARWDRSITLQAGRRAYQPSPSIAVGKAPLPGVV